MGVVFDRNGESGNIYAIMGNASIALKQEGRSMDAKQMFTRVIHSGSYDEALEIIAEYVDLIDMTEAEHGQYAH